MLLPEMQNTALTVVATTGPEELVIGAAAMTGSCRTQPLTGPGVALEVIKPCRRRGVAKAFIGTLETTARQMFAAEAIYAAKRVDEGSEEMEHWQRLGFSAVDTVEEHALPIEQFEPRLGPI